MQTSLIHMRFGPGNDTGISLNEKKKLMFLDAPTVQRNIRAVRLLRHGKTF